MLSSTCSFSSYFCKSVLHRLISWRISSFRLRRFFSSICSWTKIHQHWSYDDRSFYTYHLLLDIHIVELRNVLTLIQESVFHSKQLLKDKLIYFQTYFSNQKRNVSNERTRILYKRYLSLFILHLWTNSDGSRSSARTEVTVLHILKSLICFTRSKVKEHFAFESNGDGKKMPSDSANWLLFSCSGWDNEWRINVSIERKVLWSRWRCCSIWEWADG